MWRVQRWGMSDIYKTREVLVESDLRQNLPDHRPENNQWRFLKPFKQTELDRIRRLVNSDTYLEDESSWFCVRPIGAGGFGVVALWEQRDVFGTVLDDIVIKTTDRRTHLALKTRKHIAEEAAMMTQLNKLEDESIIYLRRFKAFDRPMEWRYYFEYCPYGDLERLRMRYKAWGQYLPEHFLWHIFKGLIESASTMEHGPFHNLEDGGDVVEKGYILHMDIKPQNVFLGREAGTDSSWVSNYPVPKVADFGLAKLTTDDDLKNKAIRLQMGTTSYHCPEMRLDLFPQFRNWYYPPFHGAMRRHHRRDDDDRRRRTLNPRSNLVNPYSLMADPFVPDVQDEQQPLGPEANVWTFGVVMYQLITLGEHYEIYNALRTLDERRFRISGGHIIPEIRTQLSPDYSPELRKLARDCLKLRPQDRPSSAYILSVILENLKKWDSLKKQECEANGWRFEGGEKVWFKDNEVKRMPAGNFSFAYPHYFWERTFNQDEVWLDPELTRLDPPNRPAYFNPWPAFDQRMAEGSAALEVKEEKPKKEVKRRPAREDEEDEEGDLEGTIPYVGRPNPNPAKRMRLWEKPPERPALGAPRPAPRPLVNKGIGPKTTRITDLRNQRSNAPIPTPANHAAGAPRGLQMLEGFQMSKAFEMSRTPPGSQGPQMGGFVEDAMDIHSG